MKWIIGGILSALALFGLLAALAPYFTTQLWWEVRSGLFWIIPVLVVLAFAGAALGSRSYTGLLTLWAILCGVGTVGWLFVHDYVEQTSYAASVTVTDDPLPKMAIRAPYTISTAQVASNLGNANGQAQTTTYIPDEQAFTTPVANRGAYQGYLSLLTQHISTTGRNEHSECAFAPAADRRFGGSLGHSLERLVNTTRRFVNWDDNDTYGFCAADGTPYIVIPLVEQDGVLVVVERPAGVAVYNGRTGQMEIKPNGDGLPGPSYPLSLAAIQRGATDAKDGFSNWLFNRAGYELPADEDQINSSNNAEFTLGKDGQPTDEHYVTPLTSWGSATAIAAIGDVDARMHGTAMQPLVLHRTNPVWLSPNAILDRINSDFGDVEARSRVANVSELVPADEQHWVATFGTPQNMIYRFTGSGDLSDPKAVCLTDLAGKVLRCGPAQDASGNIAPGLAVGGAAAPVPAVAPAPADSDLGKLPNDQLVDLIKRANDEEARRLTTTGAGR